MSVDVVILILVLIFNRCSCDLVFDDDGNLLDDGLEDLNDEETLTIESSRVEDKMAEDEENITELFQTGDALLMSSSTLPSSEAKTQNVTKKTVTLSTSETPNLMLKTKSTTQKMHPWVPKSSKMFNHSTDELKLSTTREADGSATPQGLASIMEFNGKTKAADDTTTMTNTTEGGPKSIYYPWESLLCEDVDVDACKNFKPLCSIFESVAFRKCKKTCGLCKQNHPKNKVVTANFPTVHGHMTMTQSNPAAPVFMTVCFSKSAADILMPKTQTLSLIIHDFGEIAFGGKICQNFGSHFNPFGTIHGDPHAAMKHAGDLGKIEFGSVPHDWPKGTERCKSDEMGSYSVFEHVTLFGEYSPVKRPVVLYNGYAPYLKFSSKDALACGRLSEKIRSEKPDAEKKLIFSPIQEKDKEFREVQRAIDEKSDDDGLESILSLQNRTQESLLLKLRNITQHDSENGTLD